MIIFGWSVWARVILLSWISVTFVFLFYVESKLYRKHLSPKPVAVRVTRNQSYHDTEQQSLIPNILFFLPPQLFGSQLERTVNWVQKLNNASCENSNVKCIWTMDRKEISVADAVVFYIFSRGYYRHELPQRRKLDQIWSMHIRESPRYSNSNPSAPVLRYMDGAINWTITYRRDSDIWGPYGRKIAINTTIGKNINKSIKVGNLSLDQWIAGKTDLVVGVISRCKSHSKREILIEKLRKAGLPVHIYGNCGNKTNELLANNDTSFWDSIGKRYKFYLSFENSICTDYITEKFWRTLKLGLVPVVFGGGNYEDEGPPNSYIDVRLYSSAAELAEYLFKLDREPTLYKKYLEWREHFSIRTYGGEWCKLCQVLNQRKILKINSTKVYKHIDKGWWQKEPNSTKPACEKNPRFFHGI